MKIKNLIWFIALAGAFASCTKPPTDLPTRISNELVLTDSANCIAARVAMCYGSLTEVYAIDRAKQCGFCYSDTDTLPTCENEFVLDTISSSFRIALTELKPNTKYYYRAVSVSNEEIYTYARTSKSFTTRNGVATVNTLGSNNITLNSAICNGQVVNNGGDPIFESGICYARHQDVTINDSVAVSQNVDGDYSSVLNNLIFNTQYYYRAYCKNSVGVYYGEEKTFNTLSGAIALTTISVTNITINSATCSANITSDGGAAITERGICWSTSQNPTIANSHTSNGSGIGAFVGSMTDLTLGTTYYARAYATNSFGTYYGNQVGFTTLNGAAVLSTNSVTNITPTSAICGGNIISDGGSPITARGICWSTSQNPTITDSHTSNGSGTGAFTASITGLTNSTNYYVRAYATNSVGTYYGNQVSFSTPSEQVNGINITWSSSATEAQWEFAARGGNSSQHYRYSGSNTIDDVAWYGNNSNNQTRQVRY